MLPVIPICLRKLRRSLLVRSLLVQLSNKACIISRLGCLGLFPRIKGLAFSLTTLLAFVVVVYEEQTTSKTYQEQTVQ